MERNQIIRAIEDAATAHGLSPATITSRAVLNSRLYQRMKDGGDCTTKVANRILAYIAALPAEQKAS